MVAESVAIVVALVASLTEWLHNRRVERVAGLAFGPSRRPRGWAKLAPAGRVVAITAIAWGLVSILLLPTHVHRFRGDDGGNQRHLLVLLDVSPSMRLEDAGPMMKQSRRQRAKDIIDSFLQRVSTDQYKVSVLAFFNGVKPVVIDTKDAEVIRHILEELPLYQAFKPGKTKLYDGLKEAADTARQWAPKSTSLVVITDGDTEPTKGIPTLPVSIANVLFVGVGDPRSGSFIGGRQSKQDSSTLRQLAIRFRGTYVDGNTKHIPSKVLAEMQHRMSDNSFHKWSRRQYALVACGLGGLIYALLPFLLHSLGTGWQPGVTIAKSDNARFGRLKYKTSIAIDNASHVHGRSSLGAEESTGRHETASRSS